MSPTATTGAASSPSASCQALAAATLASGTLKGWLDRGAIFALVAVSASARAFEWPTLAALLPTLVQRGMLPGATAWATTANQLAQIGGPALGGFLYAVSPGARVCVPAVLYFAGRGADEPHSGRGAGSARSAAPTLASVFSGFAFVRSRRLLLGVLSLDLFAVLFGGAVALLPIYARDILDDGPVGPRPAARRAGAGRALHVGRAGALPAASATSGRCCSRW